MSDADQMRIARVRRFLLEVRYDKQRENTSGTYPFARKNKEAEDETDEADDFGG